MIDIIFISAALLGLSIAAYSDLKTREVPDWLNYSLILFGFGIRALYSVNTSSFMPLIEGALGFAVFFAIGILMYYTGQWGGGDTKLLMGIGTLMGLSIDFTSLPNIAVFFVNLLLIGAAYGLVWSLFLSVKHWDKFTASFKKNSQESSVKIIKRVVLISSVILLVLVFFVDQILLKVLFISVTVLSISSLYLWQFAKSVEQSCMFKKVKPSKLTEGDWIEDDIIIAGKKIYSKKEFGVSKKQITQLKSYYKSGKIGKIIVKEGIPFVPSFFIAYIITLFFGSWFMMFI